MSAGVILFLLVAGVGGLIMFASDATLKSESGGDDESSSVGMVVVTLGTIVVGVIIMKFIM